MDTIQVVVFDKEGASHCYKNSSLDTIFMIRLAKNDKLNANEIALFHVGFRVVGGFRERQEAPKELM